MGIVSVNGNGNFIIKGNSGGSLTFNQSPKLNKARLQQLVGSNKIVEAFEEMLSHPSEIEYDRIILLYGRYNFNESNNSIGVSDARDYGAERNKIINSLLKFINDISGPDAIISQPIQQVINTTDNMETKLQAILKEYARTNSDACVQAQKFLDEWRAYHDLKLQRPAYDSKGRCKEELIERIELFLKNVATQKEDNELSMTERIAGLLNEKYPQYRDLKEAYILCTGRGMKSLWIEQMLESQPQDLVVQAKIAVLLENFAATI